MTGDLQARGESTPSTGFDPTLQPSSLQTVLRYWPILVALLLASVAVGEARWQIVAHTQRIAHIEEDIRTQGADQKRQLERFGDDRRINDKEVRQALGIIQLNIAKLCQSAELDCQR